MANHFVSINRGKTGATFSDFTTGTSSTTGDDLELRIADAAGWTRAEIEQALEAIERWLLSNGAQTTFPPL